MDLPILPNEIKYILEEHEGRDDAPVFYYRPLDGLERAEVYRRLRQSRTEEGEEGTGLPLDLCVDIVRQNLVRVENLTIGGEAFDLENEAHVRTVWGLNPHWQILMAAAIFGNARLSGEQEGNSDSPSGLDA